jgi:hypothetical protein
VPGNGKDLRQALAESLKAEPHLTQAEVDLHSADGDGMNLGMRQRLQELLVKAPAESPVEGEANAIRDLGLEKLGEFRTAIRGHLSGRAELADQDLAIYVKGGEGRRSAFQRALEQNLKELRERPPVASKPLEDRSPGQVSSDEVEESPPQITDESDIAGESDDRATAASPARATVTISPTQASPSRVEGFAPGTPEAEALAYLTQMEPIPLLTAALEAVGVAGDDFGFILRYGRYAQPGRSSEFLVGGLGLADLSERLTIWLDAQGASDCEVQVLDDGSGELMIYLLGHDQPISSSDSEYELD